MELISRYSMLIVIGILPGCATLTPLENMQLSCMGVELKSSSFSERVKEGRSHLTFDKMKPYYEDEGFSTCLNLKIEEFKIQQAKEQALANAFLGFQGQLLMHDAITAPKTFNHNIHCFGC